MLVVVMLIRKHDLSPVMKCSKNNLTPMGTRQDHAHTITIINLQGTVLVAKFEQFLGVC